MSTEIAPRTQAEIQAANKEKVRALLNDPARQQQIFELLPTAADQRRFLASMQTYVLPRAELHADNVRGSLVVAVYQAAKAALDLGVDANIIVRSSKATGPVARFELTVSGAIILMLRSPGASHVTCHVIRRNDAVHVVDGVLVRHEYDTIDPVARGPIVGAVARLHYHDGRVIERLIDGNAIAAARATGGNAWSGGEGPFEEMVRKTAILRLRKLVPLDSQTQGLLDEIEHAPYAEARERGPRRIAPQQPRAFMPAPVEEPTTEVVDDFTTTTEE